MATALPPLQPQPNQLSTFRTFISKELRAVVLTIVQVAVRIFFVCIATLMAAAPLPVGCHVVALPVMALSAGLLSAFFFPQENYGDRRNLDRLPPLLGPLAPGLRAQFGAQMPANIPLGAPRGIYRAGNNCSFNALIHFLEDDPQIRQWIRSLIPKERTMAAYEAFLASYRVEAEFVADFRAHVAQNTALSAREAFPAFLATYRLPRDQTLPGYVNFLMGLNAPEGLIKDFQAHVERNPDQPLHETFKNFLATYRPPLDLYPHLIRIGEAFNKPLAPFPNLKEFHEIFTHHLLAMDAPFGNFFAAYDETLQGNRAVVNSNSQELRLALSRTSGSLIDERDIKQEDAHEVLGCIFRGLPRALKMRLQEATHYDVRNQPIAELPDGISRREDPPSWCFELAINGKAPNLTQMLHDHCNEVIADSGRGVEFQGVDGQMRRYPARQREFRLVEAVPVLRFKLKRYEEIPAGQSFLARYLSSWFGAGQIKKNDTLVQMPEEIEIPLLNGAIQKYRLSSIVNHWGNTPNTGHYTAGRIVNGQYYLMDDQQVSLVDRDTWFNRAGQAYLLSYQRV